MFREGVCVPTNPAVQTSTNRKTVMHCIVKIIGIWINLILPVNLINRQESFSVTEPMAIGRIMETIKRNDIKTIPPALYVYSHNGRGRSYLSPKPWANTTSALELRKL